MTKNEDISNPFEDTERKTLAVENIVKKNKYLTILFFSQHSTHLETCPKYHPQNNERDFLMYNVMDPRRLVCIACGSCRPTGQFGNSSPFCHKLHL